MKKIKIWMTSFGARFDNVMKRIENQEAVAEQAIAEARNAAGEAKVRLNRVRRDGEALRKRIDELRSAESLWTNRAKAAAESDRERALECMRRLKQTQRDLTLAEEEQIRHGDFEKKLTQDIRTIDAKIEELKRKKNSLAAREQRAKATEASKVDCLESESIDDIFDRWEDKLIASEVLSIDDQDDFEKAFSTEEEKTELAAELEALLDKEKQ